MWGVSRRGKIHFTIMSFQIVPYGEAHKKEWNQFLEDCRNGCFLFDRDYMEYHKDRFPDHSLVIYKGNKVYALFPANKLDDTIYSHQGLTFGGLIYGVDLKTAEAIAILKMIKEYYHSMGIRKIIYKTIPYIFSNYPAQEDLYALFRYDARLFRRDVFSVIDIRNPVKFSETKRQLVRKCIDRKIQIVASSDFTEFWNLLEHVLSKYNTKPTHTLAEIRRLKDLFPSKIKLYEARKEDELLAGIVIYDYGKVVHTQYMANSDTGRKSGVLDFINHQLIYEIYKDRNYYSFGTSTEDNGQYLNEGLIQQKELLGGRAVAHDFYEIHLQ